MPRENVLQVPLNDKQIEFARKQATASKESLAGWARGPLVRAFEAQSLEQVRELARGEPQIELRNEHLWSLLFRIKYESKESMIAEVTDAECRNGRYSSDWKKGTRFVLAGSRWLHVLEEDFSSRLVGRDWVTTVRVSVNHAENFYDDEN